MPVFLSTDEGKILYADIDGRESLLISDLGVPLTDLALAGDGTLYVVSDTLVYSVDLSQTSTTPIALLSAGGIIGLDTTSDDRPLFGTSSGDVYGITSAGGVQLLGTFGTQISGGIARVGDAVYATDSTGVLWSMNISSGSVAPIFGLGLGPLAAISAQDDLLRLTVAPTGSQPQFYLFDPATFAFTFENGLQGVFEQVNGATSGTLPPLVVNGDESDEQIIGTAFDDVVNANDGADFTFARAGADTVNGGQGDDFIFGEEGDDVLRGDQGDDIVQGDEGNDSLLGGLGDDLLQGMDGVDTLIGGAGDDNMIGGNGIDWADFSSGAATVDLEILTAQDTGHGLDQLSGIENLEGSAKADAFSGNDADNLLRGRGGKDTLVGRGGDDTLFGGNGWDTMTGGEGNDRLDGGRGVDFISYLGGNAVVVTLATQAAQDTIGQGIDTIIRVEGIIGSMGDDDLTGNGRVNRFEGRGGDDTIRGGGGKDTLLGQFGKDDLRGGAAADKLRGGADNDRLDGGRGGGVDTLEGGDGADVFIYYVDSNSGPDERAVIEDFSLAEGDKVNIVGEKPTSFDSWTISDVSGGHALVDFGNGAQIEFQGYAAADVLQSWFV